ncbi:hypothetical protein GPALN_010195 [Globodera pallida]|nr:hypothetical protein GPALN_010195 [Globodera pallida]
MCCRGGCLVFRAKAQNQLKAQQAYEERKAEKRLQCRQVRRKETAVQTKRLNGKRKTVEAATRKQAKRFEAIQAAVELP